MTTAVTFVVMQITREQIVSWWQHSHDSFLKTKASCKLYTV